MTTNTAAAVATALDHREVTSLAQRLLDAGNTNLALAIVSAVEADKAFLKDARARGLLGGLSLGIESVREQAARA